LDVWIGPKFEPAATALTIMISYWLFMSGISLMSSMLIATRQIGSLAVYTWATALVNLGLSLALTPWLGLDGVILGTVLAYAIFAPLIVHLGLSRFGIRVVDYLRESLMPAYASGIVLVAVLFLLRSVVDLNRLIPLALVAVGSTLGYWMAFYLVWMRPQERVLVRHLLSAPRTAWRQRRADRAPRS
jgi:O-antigen/teichoic acid export membrane protein